MGNNQLLVRLLYTHQKPSIRSDFGFKSIDCQVSMPPSLVTRFSIQGKASCQNLGNWLESSSASPHWDHACLWKESISNNKSRIPSTFGSNSTSCCQKMYSKGKSVRITDLSICMYLRLDSWDRATQFRKQKGIFLHNLRIQIDAREGKTHLARQWLEIVISWSSCW